MKPKFEVVAPDSILLEAQALVHGPREASYDTPTNNYSRVADIVNVLLEEKLSDPVDAKDMALVMIAIKLARESHKHQRDNLVDIAGYSEVLARIEEGR